MKFPITGENSPGSPEFKGDKGEWDELKMKPESAFECTHSIFHLSHFSRLILVEYQN